MDEQMELSLRTARSRRPLRVSEVVRLVRDALESSLDEFWIVGEISNARFAPSGHFYFTLKDDGAALNVVMFRSATRRIRFKPADGMEIIARGRINLYEPRGALQFYAEEIEPRGLGTLQLAFEQLKQRLNKEGLFDASRKRPLPFLPRTIGIVSAPDGAGLRDIITIILSRFPRVHLIIRPARVQGEVAAFEIARAIDDLNEDGRAELMIVGRGGGSLEDLWAFNEEAVARAIHRSRIPVVSAVGHEIDYTIADFVADVRAPTPTAAAAMVVPSLSELQRELGETAATLAGAIEAAVGANRRQVAHLAARLRDPRAMLRQMRQGLDETSADLLRALAARLREARRHVRSLRLSESAVRASIESRRSTAVALHERIITAAHHALDSHRGRLGALAGRLDSISPLRVLERGYAVAINVRDGRAVVDSSRVEVGDELELWLHRGRLRARTTSREI